MPALKLLYVPNSNRFFARGFALLAQSETAYALFLRV